MPTRISEFIGFILGWPAGLIFATGSLLRNARIFHPRGLIFSAVTELSDDCPVPLPSHTLVRFSAGWWKEQEWPDVLGVALRFSEKPVTSEIPGPRDQDLLLATFRRPWQIFAAPFFTEHHDYLSNHYYAISPFSLSDGRIVDFMIDPGRGHRSGGNREENLASNVMGGNVVLRFMMKERNQESWKIIAKVTLKEEIDLDQEGLRFHPFRCLPGIRPYGFLQHLRYGTYKMSQWVRPGRRHPGLENVSPS